MLLKFLHEIYLQMVKPVINYMIIPTIQVLLSITLFGFACQLGGLFLFRVIFTSSRVNITTAFTMGDVWYNPGYGLTLMIALFLLVLLVMLAYVITKFIQIIAECWNRAKRK